MKWAYAVTTVPMRLETTLPRTLESLKGAGFDQPHLFVDGTAAGFERFGCEITYRSSPVRTYGNWVLALAELYIRNPSAERYAIFQDDFITYKNLRQYLEKCPFPEHCGCRKKCECGVPEWKCKHPRQCSCPSPGYWNLFTMPSNQRLCPHGYQGWYRSNQFGRGAVALVFSLQGVVTLLSHQYMIDRPQDAHRGWKSVDGAIVTAMARAGAPESGGWVEYVHSPSLVQHIGYESSMGSNPQHDAPCFRGEGYDALRLFGPTRAS